MSELFHVPFGKKPTTVQILTGISSEYEHKFGGRPLHEGVVAQNATDPLQLLYNFDLTDPNCRLKIPGCRWLPLYTAFRFEQSSVSYRIVSDARIEILNQPKTTVQAGFPHADYPIVFPEFAVSLGRPRQIIYDEELEEMWGFSWEDEFPPRPPNRYELIALEAGINQQLLPRPCANKDCVKPNVNYLASFRGEWLDSMKLSMFGGDVEYFVFVYYICYSCFTVETMDLSN